VDAVEPRLRGLAALLERCAERAPGAARDLRQWDGGRLEQMLERILDDPERVRRALDRLLADLSGGQGAFRGHGEAAAQDWLFARMRRAVRETGGLPPLRAFPSPPVAPRPAPVPWREPEPVTAPPAHELEIPTGIANPRLRPPSAPVRAHRAISSAPPARRARAFARWLGIILLLAAAAASGLAASLLALRWQAPHPAIPVAVVPQLVLAPEPAAPPPTAAASDASQQVGPPIAARDLPVVAAPVVRAAPAPPPAPLPPAATTTMAPRVVIHYGAGGESVEVAAQLAEQLRASGYGRVEIWPVTFDVATASIRYFYRDDRPGAERLVRAIAPFLSWHGRAPPSTPIGFTDFRPLPRPGTLEIWLPRR
jgi:hypothetical protein